MLVLSNHTKYYIYFFQFFQALLSMFFLKYLFNPYQI
uniref:Uncharacterized protein n=1 Tax=Myoviridae sp. ctA4D8 TaxID=2823535 RepID=A0A8S5L6K4_9CAUD|nr:MAG TPA: hypothetical protein [Myoviridae sp. ctA4D8]